MRALLTFPLLQEPASVQPAPSVPETPAMPALPAQAQAPEPHVFTVPQTRQELAAVRARRSELSRQLTSAAQRREELARELRGADAEAREGIAQRIKVLDERIVQLERDIAETGRQLTMAPASVLAGGAGTSAPAEAYFGGLSAGQVTGISIVFIIFVLFPLAIALGRLIWKRGSVPRLPPALVENNQRLERLEQAVDSIAVEVERIGEGQRFVTRLLSESGVAPSARVGTGEPVGVRRDGA